MSIKVVVFMNISEKRNKTFTDIFSLVFQRIFDVCKGLLF